MKTYNLSFKIYNQKYIQIKKTSVPIRFDFSKKTKMPNLIGAEEKITTISEKLYRAKRCLINSRKRSIGKIFDYARANEFDIFVTLTFNPQRVDSFDYKAVSKALTNIFHYWRKSKAPDLKYIFVPELHKSGRWHFHGMMANVGNINLIDSGKRDNSGRIIYNIESYKLGFTTATYIEDTLKTSLYISKYITKDVTGLTRGQKKYWISRNLNKPDHIKINTNDLDQISNIPNLNDFVEIFEKTVEFEAGDFKKKIEIIELEKMT